MTASHPDFGHADSVITIDGDAVVANWRYLDGLSARQTETAAVVKANAYGLGVDRLAPLLAGAGCRTFFVASLEEGIALRHTLSEAGHPDCRILVLGGCHADQQQVFIDAKVTPVINSLDQLERWRGRAAQADMSPGAALHFDTGMTRLGLDPEETAWLIRRQLAGETPLAGADIRYVMSHLTAGEDPMDESNSRQLSSFGHVCAAFPDIPASLANSGGTLLGTPYHMALTRPGIALYGLHPAGHHIDGNQREQADRLRPAVTWQARILQRRTARAGDRVGYNGTHRLRRDSVIFTLGVGYADGYPRALGNLATVTIAGMSAPVVGRVSMDSITVDVTGLDDSRLAAASHAEILGDGYRLAHMAHDAGTIGYEILTGLGQRPGRRYVSA